MWAVRTSANRWQRQLVRPPALQQLRCMATDKKGRSWVAPENRVDGKGGGEVRLPAVNQTELMPNCRRSKSLGPI